MAAASSACNMLFEELVEEDSSRKPASACPYCEKALAFHRRRQRAIGGSGVVNLASIEIKDGDRRISMSVTIPVKLAMLEQRVCIVWPEFKVMSHVLCLHDNVLTEEDISLYDGAQIVLINHCKDFTKFQEEDAMAYAKISRIIVNDDVFHSSVEVRDCDIDFAKEELGRRLQVCDIFQTGDFTMREFISPMLVNALVTTPAVKLIGSRCVTGTLGWGPVDFLINYCDFPVCVTEAKREATDRAVNHNIAQLIAAREAYCVRNKCSQEDISDVPSCGIVSTGENFIFLRYICQGGEWIMIRSKSFKITLDEHRPLSRDQVGTVLAKVLGVIEFHIATIDSSIKMPRRVLPEASSSFDEEEHFAVE